MGNKIPKLHYDGVNNEINYVGSDDGVNYYLSPFDLRAIPNRWAYDNIKSGESTTLTLDSVRAVFGGINDKFGIVDTALSGKANSSHTQASSTITDMSTVQVLVTYTDNTTETLTLFKQTNNQ